MSSRRPPVRFARAAVRLAAIVPAAAAAALAGGCRSAAPRPPAYVENAAVTYHFTNVENPADRERVYRIARSVALPDTLDPKDVPDKPDFDLRFVVPRLSALDTAHELILFVPKPGAAGDAPAQAFNPRGPAFAIGYDTVSIGAGIDVTVRFKVTPGARLFYRAQGGEPIDVTKQVSETGIATIPARINRGQEFFYAKAISGGVTKWLKINIFTQQVQEITQAEFEGK
ncbi:MAG TPA: hypothetical protein VF796_01000 [Humisphaera sp.]